MLASAGRALHRRTTSSSRASAPRLAPAPVGGGALLRGPSAPRAPCRWASTAPEPEQQLTISAAELERIVERAIGRVAKDVAKNRTLIQEQSELVAANTHTRFRTEKRLWNEDNMEKKIEKVHDVLVAEEQRLKELWSLGTTGLTQPVKEWNRYSWAVVMFVVGVLCLFKREIYDKIGKEVSQVTSAAISDPKLVDNVQKLLVAIGKSPETIEALTVLFKQVFAEQELLDSLSELTTRLLAKDATQESMQLLFIEKIFGSELVRRAAGDFAISALDDPVTKAELQVLIKEQMYELLRDEQTHHVAADATKHTLQRTFW